MMNKKINNDRKIITQELRLFLSLMGEREREGFIKGLNKHDRKRFLREYFNLLKGGTA